MHASNHVCKFLSAIGFCLTATLAQAAGLRSIDIPADADGPAIHGMIWYPCAEPPGEIRIDMFILPGVKDCPLAGDHLPLIAASHGQGAALLVNHDTAETLADNGFVVAAINHPGDTSQDLSRSDDLSVFVERPTDIKRLIDFMIGASPFAARIDQEQNRLLRLLARWLYRACAARRQSGLGRGGRRTIVGKASFGSANRSSAGHTRRNPSRTIRGSRPPCLPIRWPSFSPRRAWRLSRRRFNSGRRNGAGTACCPDDVAAVDANLPTRTRISRGFERRTFGLFRPCPPALVQGAVRGLRGCAGFRPRRVPRAIQRRRARLLPKMVDSASRVT